MTVTSMNTSAEEGFRPHRLTACQSERSDDELLDRMVSAYRAANLRDVAAITEELVKRSKARRHVH
jgi:hypothetical protein